MTLVTLLKVKQRVELEIWLIPHFLQIPVPIKSFLSRQMLSKYEVLQRNYSDKSH